tara:strand:+ start:603 stop:1220 length:618 start_codon:yes stop_codon:yes gene_type:complete
MKFQFDPAELTKEKSLWDIFVASKKIKITKFNKIVLMLVAILSGAYAFFLEENTSIILEKSRELSELGLTYSITILGFLIAGFTIFATLTKPELLLRMMDETHKKTQLTYLKYNYFVFMRVFIFYLIVSSIFLFVIMFCSPNGIIPHIIRVLPQPILIKSIAIKASYVLLTCCISFLILLLKGFIYNIYSITMNNLRWEHRELTK